MTVRGGGLAASAALLASCCALFPPLSSAQGTDLGPPGYLHAARDVSSHADLALDLRDMSSRLRIEDYDGMRSIYSAGRNSALFASDGTPLPNKRPLRWGNTNAKAVFRKDATYLFHVYGLARGNPDVVTDRMLLYADGFVDDLITKGSPYAVEAARVLNLWMFAVHRVWDVFRACAGSPVSFTNRGNDSGGDEESAMAKLDEAMAYWIGSGGFRAADSGGGSGGGADNDVWGYSLFGLAQELASQFGTDKLAGESYLGEGLNLADANYKVQKLYDEARNLLKEDGACQSFESTYVTELYGIVNDMVGQMTVPLVQGLVSSMYEKDAERVKVFAMSVVPQLSACRPSSHAIVQNALLDNEYDPSKFGPLVAEIQSVYECLGMTCADIGNYKNGKVRQCADVLSDLPLAGYAPTSPVREQSKIDIDVLQIKVSTKMGSYDVAQMIYARGRNSGLLDTKSRKFRTLRMMAKSRDRNLVDPFYDEFQMYFDDDDYADTVVDATMRGAGKWGGKGSFGASASQRSEVVVKTLQYQVVYMYALTMMHEALETCLVQQEEEGDDVGGAFSVAAADKMAHKLDEAVAYLTGSLEGEASGGSARTKDGLLLYGLANLRCEQFGQCKNGGPARILGVYQDLFYAAKGAIKSGNCMSLTTTVHKIEHVIMVPVLQSVIRYAIKNERLPTDSPSKDLAEGEVFTLSVLPIVDLYEDDSADVLERNMVVERGRKPVADGDQAVADALYAIMDEFGIPCDFIGTTEGVTPCVRDEEYMSRSGGAVASVVGFGGQRGELLALSSALTAGQLLALVL